MTVRAISNKYRELHIQARKTLNPYYSDMFLATMFYRGMSKNIEDAIKYFEYIQKRNSELVNKLIMNDKDSSIKDDGLYQYSGVGKEYGLQSIACMAKYIPSSILEDFFRIRQEIDKQSSKQYVDKFCKEHYNKSFKELCKTL